MCFEDSIDFSSQGQQLGTFFGDDKNAYSEGAQVVAFQGAGVIFVLFEKPVIAIRISGKDAEVFGDQFGKVRHD